MKKRVFFAVLALFSFAAFFSCSNAAGGSDSESSKPSSASASKKPGYVTLTGTVSVSGAVPKILSDNYDSSSDNDGVSRSAQPGINTSGSEATMEYFARATSGDLVSEGAFGTGAEAKMFGLELQAGIEWTIVVGVREKSASKPILARTVYLSSTWKVTPDPAAPTISHNFVPVPNTSGGTGSIALKIKYSPSLYEITPKFVDGPDSVNLDALNFENWTFIAADDGRIYKRSSIPSGKYELCLDFKNTDSQVLVYSTIQSVTVANGMITNSWVADSSSSAVSPISAAGEFNFNSNASTLMASFLGTNLFVGKVSDDCDAPADTNSGNYLSPLKTVTGAVKKIAQAGSGGADYVIRVSGEVSGDGINSAANITSALISTSNAKSLTIIGTSGSDTDCIKSASSQASAVNITTNVPITFKKIKIMGSKSGSGAGAAINAFGGSKVTIDEGSLITGGKIGVNITGDSTKVTMKGGSFSGNDADVYLESGKVLTVDCNLSDVADKGIVVSLQSWTRGTQFLEAGASLGTLSDAIVGKFDFTKTGWDTPIDASNKKATIDADIFVAANGVDKDSENVENTIGNKNYPFASIKQASKYLDASHGTIYVSGSVSGAQEIPASVASTCTAIKLTGLNPLPTSGTNAYVPSDEINAGGAAGAGTALTVATSVPVTIENLKITGGYSGTIYTGGGISVNAGSVTLSDGAWVSGNTAGGTVGCGGGVYVANVAKLFMKGKALVGNKSVSSAPSTYTGGANNLTVGEGGGIHNRGSVYIGCNESGEAAGYALADGYGVRGNWSNQEGGGIANYGTLKIASGEIAYNMANNHSNSAIGSGGGVYHVGSALVISGGSIYANAATGGGALYIKGSGAVMTGGTIGGDTDAKGNVATRSSGQADGGAITILDGKSFEMSGGTISHNTAKTCGGAVCNYGTFTMSGGLISANTASGTTVLTSSSSYGGAVYNYGTFNLSGAAYIPAGAGTTESPLNDVFLNDGKTVTVAGTLSPTTTGAAGGTAASVSVGALTPNEYKRGKKIVLAESGVSVNENLWKKIVLADNDGDWTKFKKTENAGETTEKNYVAITADVFVAGASSTTVSGVTYGKGLTTTEGGLGTKSKPFKFISDAVAVFEDASSPAVVTIVGTTYPVAQEIPDTFTTTSNASALTLKGLSSSSIGTIKRYTTAPTTVDATGSALKVNSTVPVTIQDITITGGKTSGNGGGINIAKTGASVTLSSGVNITGNTAVNGGGVYILSGTTLDMQGGIIGGANAALQNTASTAGGAVYHGGTFKMKGASNLYFSNNAETKNDVFLAGGNTINVSGALNTGCGATITPSAWTRGKVVLSGSYSSYYSQFKVSDSDWSTGYRESINWTLNDDLKSRIGAQIWVAGTYNNGTLSTGVGTNATGGKAPDDSNRGTKKQPYATIKKAVEQCWTTDKNFTINIDGTLGGAQTVPAKNTTNNTGLASEIILNGNTLSNTSTAILNGGFASLGDDNHTLKIDTAVSVSIRNLKIIKGWATNGGGVYISSGSTVYMSGGVVVTENKATNGGGIANYGKLLIFGTARIGGTGTGTATDSTGNYATNFGGGILNAGNLYLGYDVYSNSQNYHVAEFTGGITQNYAIGKSGNTVNAGKGGGIYNANGECVIKSGNVSYNYSWVGGGIYSAKTLTMHGGSIENNTATYSDDDSPSGGGVYAYSSTFTMSGGNISGNKASSHGGGVGLVGAKLYMYGLAVIGTSADGYATGSNACSNYAAKNGGGVYAANDDNTSVLLGYTNGSNVADTFNGGISYNCCGNGFNGGGIYYSGKEEQLKIAKGYICYNNALNGYGGGICCNSKKCIISGGEIYGNQASYGGGVSLTGGSIEMSAGSIYKNSANNGGGGVHVSNTTGSSFTMSGGIIGGTSGNENTCNMDGGGAIYAQKDITFAGGASVPYNGTAKKNDVYLGSGIKIAVTGNNVPSGSNVATIVPYIYNTTSPVMGSDSASVASSKFKVRTDSNGAAWFIETTGKLKKGISLSAADAISEIANLKSSSTLQITGSISTQQFNSIESALMSLYTGDNTKRITLDLSKSSITSIPEGAFNTNPNTTGGCNVLSSVILPTTVTTIEKDAFQGCSNLTSITGLDNVTTLGKACFMGCSLSNFTIPPKVTVIPEEAFYHCGVLGTITIPEKVTTIGKNAFGCTSLTSVTFAAPNKVTSIGEGAFHYCSFTSFSIPSGITVIEKSTFANCARLTSIAIPSNITKIYASAFHYSSIGSTNLTGISISTTGWKLNGTTATDMSSASANVAKFTVYNSSDYYSR